MKTKYVLVILITIVSQNLISQKNKVSYNYSENISVVFEIFGTTSAVIGTATPGVYSYNEKDEKFLVIDFKFKNESNSIKKIDLRNITLKDQYSDETRTALFVFPLKGPEMKLGKGGKKGRRLFFAIPRTAKSGFLSINGNDIKIEYK